MTLKTRLTSRAVALVAACGTALGLASVPALAAPTITVTGVVTDADGNPLEGISVYGFQGSLTDVDDEDEWEDEAEADLGDTDEDGRFTYTTRIGAAAEWGYGFTTDTPWTFVYTDNDDTAAQPFEQTFSSQVTLAEGRNELPTQALVPGALINGHLETPSGKGIKNAEIFIDGDSSVFGDYASTGDAGAFRFGGLSAGTYTYDVLFETEDDFFDANIRTTTQVARGQEVSQTLKTKVPCTRAVSVSSPSRKTTKLAIRTTAKDFGVNIPGGTVTVKRGTKTLATRTLSSTSSLTTLTFGSQPTGTQKYTVSYKSGDCRGWASTSKSVSVRK